MCVSDCPATRPARFLLDLFNPSLVEEYFQIVSFFITICIFQTAAIRNFNRGVLSYSLSYWKLCIIRHIKIFDPPPVYVCCMSMKGHRYHFYNSCKEEYGSIFASGTANGKKNGRHLG